MPIFYQKIIMREDLQANPGVLYVFGDNVERKGMAGQAAEMRGEPNAIGVATKWKPTNQPDAFFNDDQFDQIIPILTQDLTPVYNAVIANKIVVWPQDGIGTGYARLHICAPRILRVINDTRRQLANHIIESRI